MSRVFIHRQGQVYGLRVGRTYVSLAGPVHPVLWSERNRRGVSVLTLLGGWRIRFRKDPA